MKDLECVGYKGGDFIPQFSLENATGMKVEKNCLFKRCHAFLLRGQDNALRVSFVYRKGKNRYLKLYLLPDWKNYKQCRDFSKFNDPERDFPAPLEGVWNLSVSEGPWKQIVTISSLGVGDSEGDPCSPETVFKKG